MSRAIATISVTDATAAMKRGENIVYIQPIKVTKNEKGVEEPKSFQGCLFFEIKYRVNVHGPDGKVTTKEAKMFEFKNCRTTKLPASPEEMKENNTDKKDSKYAIINTNVEAAGELGEFLVLLDKQYKDAVERGRTEGPDYIKFLDNDNSKIKPLVKTKTSKKSGNQTIEKPLIYIRVKHGKHSDNHPIIPLRGKECCVFHEESTKRVVRKAGGVASIEYDPAYVLDEHNEPMLDENKEKVVLTSMHLHHQLGYGSEIVKGVLDLGSLSSSNLGTSLPLNMIRAVITRASAANTGDAEFETDNAAEIAELEAMQVAHDKLNSAQMDTINDFVDDL